METRTSPRKAGGTDSTEQISAGNEATEREVNRLTNITGGPELEPDKHYDPFDLKTIRINQATLSGSATKLVSSYSVRKPRKNAFFRVHPAEDHQVESFIYVDKDERGMEKETYFVDSGFALQIEDADLAILFQKVVLHLVIERHAEKPFVWPLKYPIPGGKDNDYWRSAREHAETGCGDLVEFLAYSGARATEAVGVRWQDVDLERGRIYIAPGKTGQARHIPLLDSMRDLLTRIEADPRWFRAEHRRKAGNIFSVIECEKALTSACIKAGASRMTQHDLYEDQHSVDFDDRKHIKFVKGLLPKFGLADHLKDWLEAQGVEP